MAVNSELAYSNGSSTAIDLVNNIEGTTLQKILEIDKLEASGQIRTKTATMARRVLKSQEAVDAVTNTEVMADMVQRVYDLNSIADTNAKDYLVGINNIKDEILELQANGELNSQDVEAINKQISTLTSAKLSTASQEVGRDFRSSTKRFEAELPPQYRGEAIRNLFYRTNGKEDISREEYDKYTNEIIDNIKNQTRQKALEKTQEIIKLKPDEDFKTMSFLATTKNPQTGKQFTIDDVRQTAKETGMTEQAVLDYLKTIKQK